MFPRIVSVALVFAVLFAVVVGCGDGSGPTDDGGADADGKPVVFTTFYPTTYFASRIAGDLAVVLCPLPDGADPIFWQPTPEQVIAYQEADLVIINGASFEKWVGQVSLREEKLLDTARGFEGEFLTFQNATTHSHGPSGEHTHEGVDGHTWLDPMHATAQAAAILSGLQRLLPDDSATLQKNYDALAADLNTLHAALEVLKKDYRGEAILASHPAYNYLAARYELDIQNLDLDPDAPFDEQPIDEIRAAAEKSGARFLLWESSPAKGVAGKLEAETGLTSVVISPCELPSAEDIERDGDYMAVMQANVEKLRPVLRPKD